MSIKDKMRIYIMHSDFGDVVFDVLGGTTIISALFVLVWALVRYGR